MDNLDEKIKLAFNLYTGARSAEEDKEIYDYMIDRCFLEMISFIEENLGEEEGKKFVEELEKLTNDTNLPDEKKQSKILLLINNSLKDIPDCQFRVNKRVEYLIYNLSIPTK